MSSLSWIGWIVFFLLSRRTLAQSPEVQCTVAAVQELHPVQGLLERFDAGPGCAARESGNKETHVIAVGRASNSPGNKITVLLKPLSVSPAPLRAIHLLLSSKVPVSWWIEAERLASDLTVLVQVSLHSSVQSNSVHLHIEMVHSLPFHPRVLHRWALRRHGNLSSLTHVTHANRVYVRLGEDPTMPAVCQLQSMFLSHNYMTSDLQPQEVQGCTPAPPGGNSPEVHVIKLHSAGSGLCGSLQVEVIVSLVPPTVHSNTQEIVLILSSSVPVNWAIAAHGVQGHVCVHASNSVSPPFPPEPNLILSSTVNSDLSTMSDLLAWARESGITTVTSYTEADLANRFVIHLAGHGTVMTPLVSRPPWSEERRLRLWLSDAGKGGRDRESFTVQCKDGRLSVTVDRHILQISSVPVAAVTLQDPTCQAQSNGSHFLLVFPVISCQTEGILLGQSKGVQYKNTVLLWRDEPRALLALNETEKKSRSPLSIHFSCLVPSLSSPADADEVNTPQAVLDPWALEGPEEDPRPRQYPTPRRRSGPLLTMQLFISESYEQKQIGPCVITAENRVYAEISANGPLIDVVEVKSCVISPQSDPKKSPFWSIIWDGCSSDPSLIFAAKTNEEEEAEDDDREEEEKEETEGLEKDRDLSFKGKTERRIEPHEEILKSMRVEEEMQLMRFSFIMRPVYNESMQFLHCSVLLCDSDMTRGNSVMETVKRDCHGRLQIPPLISKSPRHQCEIRNLSRPMVVTQPISSLVPKLLRPPAGQRTKRLSVSPLASPDPEHSSFVAETGPVLGIVFVAFVMGVSLMGGLWCIYSYTGIRQTPLGGAGDVTDETPGGHNTWDPSSVSNQSTSSV
ncbi:transforming growth factor beta receptor type 3 [Sphaeramia orbicularis]|uniref:transforming growth factor beta receptor type 3 n=1 Tax=Sphaeramia orbicularis TaxID=375764 RepID=UPI00117CC535|nr:transforming growth factor beta receptor type 3-like [Sphaeramia orbicularis]